MATTFRVRSQIGDTAVQELAAVLSTRGFSVFETGQERWLSRAVHTALRFVHDDVMVRAVRYMPDLLAWREDWPLAYWEAKSNTTPGTPSFSVEVAALEEYRARAGKGERVVVAFRDTDSGWSANWAQNLPAGRDMSGRRHEAQGSHTPYVLLPKTSTLPLVKFIGMNVLTNHD